MSEQTSASSKRPRAAYSCVICLGCLERRIRCELPNEVEIPEPGELRAVHRTPCYRCKKLVILCVIRRTRLGRPGPGGGSTTLPAAVQDETQLAISSPIDLPMTQGSDRFGQNDMFEDEYSLLRQPNSHTETPPLADRNSMIAAKVQILPLRRVPRTEKSPPTCKGASSSGDSQSITAKRVRASKPKVKTGCLTCKIRRIKCDEIKPACLKCTSTGRKCDGYSAQPPMKSKGVIRHTDIAGLSKPTRGLDLSPLKTSFGEMRALEYFCVKTAPGMGMYFDSDFWSGFIVQASVAEPALRHAMVAVGRFAEQRELRDIQNSDHTQRIHLGNGDSATVSAPTRIKETDSIDPLAILNYNKSVGLLSKLASTPETTDIVLLACILFVCVELLRGDTEAALRHLNGGMSIIVDYSSRVENSQASDLMFNQIKNNMLPFFNRLEMLYALFGNDAPWQYPITLSEIVPTTFASLENTRDSLVNLLNLSLRFIRSMDLCRYERSAISVSAFEEQTTLLNQLLLWRTRFSAYQTKHASRLTSRDMYAYNVLEIQRLIAYNWVSVATSPFECSHDAYLPVYTAAVTLAEQLFEFARAHTESPRYANAFTIDCEIVGPIHWVCIKCREPGIRRRAIAVLRGLRRQEGMWDSKMAAVIAERVVAIEEIGLEAGELPSEEARVHYSFTDSWPGVTSTHYSITHRTKPHGVYAPEWSDRVEHFTL